MTYMKRALLFTLALLVLWPATASALDQATYQNWVLGSQTPNPPTATLAVHEAGCPYYGGEATGCTDWWSSVWVAPASTGKRETLYHEEGHMFDYLRLNDTDRTQFMHILARDGQPYLQELFAIEYGRCGLGGTAYYAAGVTDGQHTRVCQFLWNRAPTPVAFPVVTAYYSRHHHR